MEARVKWPVGTFKALKFAEVGGIFSAALQGNLGMILGSFSHGSLGTHTILCSENKREKDPNNYIKANIPTCSRLRPWQHTYRAERSNATIITCIR